MQVKTIVPYPKLLITDPDLDPDPQMENQDFGTGSLNLKSRILVPDPDPTFALQIDKRHQNFAKFTICWTYGYI